jgi:hypothetical protein
MAAGGLGGGISSKLAGGTFEDGFRNGLISAGLNHGLHALAAELQSDPTCDYIKIPKPTKKGQFACVEMKIGAPGHEEVSLNISLEAVQGSNELYWKVSQIVGIEPRSNYGLTSDVKFATVNVADAQSHDYHYNFKYSYNETIKATWRFFQSDYAVPGGFDCSFHLNNSQNQFKWYFQPDTYGITNGTQEPSCKPYIFANFANSKYLGTYNR